MFNWLRGLRLLSLGVGYGLSGWLWVPRARWPAHLRAFLEASGPLFIKLGQLLSTRPDILPPDFLKALAQLQDQVPPFPAEQAIQSIESALGGTLRQYFATFDSTPLAAASVAQVHAATLHSGEAVVVKVQRPGMRVRIRQDMQLLRWLSESMSGLSRRFRTLGLPDLIRELEDILDQELDFLVEGAQAAQLRRNIIEKSEQMQLYVPQVHWAYSTSQILVLERIYGISIRDLDALRRAGFGLRQLAEQFARVFLRQIFQDAFFHADLHPGNVFVDPASPSAPRYFLVDFGVVGTLSPRDQYYLASNLLALFRKDYRRVALLHVESHWVPSTVRLDLFETAIRTVCEPLLHQPLSQISFGKTLLQLLRTVQRFDMRLQPQLLLLQKTLINLEGVCRQLCPDLDLWSIMQPLLEDWLREQMGWKARVQHLKNRWPEWLDRMLSTDAAREALPPETPQAIPQEDTAKPISRWLYFCNLGLVAVCCFQWGFFKGRWG